MLRIDTFHFRVMTGMHCWDAAQALSWALNVVDKVDDRYTRFINMLPQNDFLPRPLDIDENGELLIVSNYLSADIHRISESLRELLDKAEEIEGESDTLSKLKQSLFDEDTDWNMPLDPFKACEFGMLLHKREELCESYLAVPPAQRDFCEFDIDAKKNILTYKMMEILLWRSSSHA